MKNLLLTINIALSIWLIIASGIIQLPDLSIYQIVALLLGGLLLFINTVLLKLNVKSLYILGFILSVASIVVSFMVQHGIMWQMAISSILIFLILLFTLGLRVASKSFMF